MRIRAVLALSFILISPFVFARQVSPSFDRSAYYAAMSSNKIELIKDEEERLDQCTHALKDAFVGALLMKKAGLVAKSAEKISLFKEGHKKLDNAISKNAENPELRFLRLMIQENAPKVVKYRGDIEKDSTFLKRNFRQLLPEVQKVVIDYSKTSKVLTPADF
jgi:hypothetical protein